MHRPWEHTDDIADMFEDGRVTDKSVQDSLRRSLDNARSLEKIALQQGIPIHEPFAGLSDGVGLVVLGPTADYYESLLPSFRCTPTPSPEAGVASRLLSKLSGAVKWVAETFNIETLDDTGETTAENNTSAILMLRFEGKCCLFTGDAGIPALSGAMDHLQAALGAIPEFSFVQVPHHGSRRNVGPTILDRIVGPKKSVYARRLTAYVSAPLGETRGKHPSRRVTNAFHRRGAAVHATQGQSKWHHHNAPARSNYGPSEPLPFYNQVEE